MTTPQTKSTQTKRLIEATFLDLLNQRPLSEITVKDITAACHVNRNTFYYHFKSIPDLIESITKSIIDDLIQHYPPHISSVEECLIATLNFTKENKSAIDHIYHSANRAVFERHLWHICEYAVSVYLDSIENEVPITSDSQREVISSFLKYEFFGFAIDWLNHGMPEIEVNNIATLAALFSPKQNLRRNSLPS